MTETADLLFELGTEELPPTALSTLSTALTNEFVRGLEEANISFGEISQFATPRRLGLLIKHCSINQPDQEIEKRGPAVKAAFDGDGNPTKAAMGFASSCGTTVDQLGRISTAKGEWLAYQLVEKGKPTASLLADIAKSALDKLPIPKRMRWGSSDVMFVRPAHWILFLLGDNIVPCELLNLKSSNKSYGHRFHHPDEIQIHSPVDYQKTLHEKGKVITDFSLRKNRIRELVQEAATSIDGHVPIDEKLLDEVTALVEWPVAIVGSFDEEYLEVPHEALILTMKKNQKYFPVFDNNGNLINHFITISNIESKNPQTIRDGNQRVIRPRLSDAKFFWQQDGKQSLENRLDHLKEIVFQKELGSIYDKSSRVSSLGSTISDQIGGDTRLAQRAGLLSRCDLVTEMVYEFADMQGIMGRYQAKRDGEPDELATAMEEIYLPRFSGDKLPETKTGIAIALADRLDTLTGIFGIGLKPSGTKDPFALRRASLGIIRILRKHSLTLNIPNLIDSACKLHGDSITNQNVQNEVNTYIMERLKGEFTDEGYSVGLVNSVASVQPASLPDFVQRIEAVSDFSKLEEAENLAAANKRIHNILRKNTESLPGVTDPSLFENSAESDLFNAVTEKESLINPLIENNDYKGILSTLATLREPVDTFFDDVMVMADDDRVRLNRLSLLERVTRLFLLVADVSVLQDS
jgi:glycyl-tRNA synthetase beta chain